MFKKITINLAGPICSCEEMDISWGIWNDVKGNPGLSLTCKKCETQLKIPNNKFVANFNVDVPYPEIKKKEKEEEVKEKRKESNITDPEKSNIIPFGRKKDKNRDEDY